jgi:hypothetical protein
MSLIYRYALLRSDFSTQSYVAEYSITAPSDAQREANLFAMAKVIDCARSHTNEDMASYISLTVYAEITDTSGPGKTSWEIQPVRYGRMSQAGVDDCVRVFNENIVTTGTVPKPPRPPKHHGK